MNRREGQSLTEFCVVLGVICTVALGATRFWMSVWRKTQCTHLVFEATHRARAGLAPTREQSRVRVTKTPFGATGEAVCGDQMEKIFLPSLSFYDKTE